jgi:hypothetical protein
VTVELARRLLQSGAIAREQLDAALIEAANRQVALIRALAEHNPGLPELLERELGQLDAPVILTVRAVPELCAGLPEGLCETLLAVPVRRDPKSSVIDVAAVDPFDPHVVSELEFHLRSRVRMLRAPYQAVLSALEGLHLLEKAGRRARKLELIEQPTHGLGTVPRAAESEPPATIAGFPRVDPSEPPGRPGSGHAIPLVRRPGPAAPGATAVANASAAPYAVSPSEPVLALRPKASFSPTQDPFDALTKAGTPDDVIAALLGAAWEVGPLVLFAIRGAVFEGRAGSGGVRPDRVRGIRIGTEEPSVLRSAVRAGYYLGCVPSTSVHEPITLLLPPGAAEEVYVVPVQVSGKPVLVLLLAGFDRAFVASKYADRLASAAAEALERIIVTRKRK